MIIENNMRIYQCVFPYLAKRKIPFLFTSSYLQAQVFYFLIKWIIKPTAYGAVKRLGERWVESLKIGRSVRLWNVYGVEPMGPRSHVITDWITQCLTNGEIRAHTNGKEARQFLHVSDCAAAFVKLMLMWNMLPPSVDLSGGVWTRISDLASIIAKFSPVNCTVILSERKAVARARLDPRLDLTFHREWRPLLDINEGIKLFVTQCLHSGIAYDDGNKELHLANEKDL